MRSLGKLFTVDMYGCKFDVLNNPELIRGAMETAVKEANMTLLSLTCQPLESEGLTALALLAESHMSIHTNPKLGYAAIDIFTLSESCRPERAVLALRKILKPDKTKTTRIFRGDFGSQKDMKPRMRISIAPMRRVKNTGAKVLRFLRRNS